MMRHGSDVSWVVMTHSDIVTMRAEISEYKDDARKRSVDLLLRLCIVDCQVCADTFIIFARRR